MVAIKWVSQNVIRILLQGVDISHKDHFRWTASYFVFAMVVTCKCLHKNAG
jgi:hypothetical protein